MIQYVLWAITFIFLWLSLFWINYLYAQLSSSQRRKFMTPEITIAIPAFNEEKTLSKTLDSLRALNYPQNHLKVIVVDDGSVDRTAAIAYTYQQKYSQFHLRVLRTKNQGKSKAINTALAQTTTPFFALLDADTRVSAGALSALVQEIFDTQAAAVISVVKVDNPQNMYERLQHVEYTLSNLFRRLMGVVDTLFLTHGGFCLFRTAVLKKVHGFSEASGNTEDLELGLRLKSRKYHIVFAKNAVTYTTVPKTFLTLWRQRVRWYRGFVYNHIKFRKFLFCRTHGAFSLFQLPLNIFSIPLLMLSIGLVLYGTLYDVFEFVYRSMTIPSYFVDHLFDIPTLTEMILAQNVQITLPLFLSTLIGLFVVYEAFRQSGERIRSAVLSIWLYIIVFPYVTSLHWVFSLCQEALQMKRKWR